MYLATLVSVTCLLSLSCGSSSGATDGGAAVTSDAIAADSIRTSDAFSSTDAENCQPPHMMFIVDRTMSMHRRPDGSVPANTPAGRMESKWYLAITAIESVTTALDSTVQFGLELFPIDRGGVCVTLSERINGTTATNINCEQGEVTVSPALDTSVAIASELDPETTRLCRSTPIGAGLGTALTHLVSIEQAGTAQYAVLLTDGQDTCDGNTNLSLDNMQALASVSVKTYVIGFDNSGTGVDHDHLNNLACAGQTAPSFPTPCVDDGAGNYTAAVPGGATLYLLANDATQLQAQLEQVAGEVCCNCIE